MTLLAFLILFVAVAIGYTINLRAARAIRAGGTKPHSLDGFHGGYAALVILVPTFFLIIFWMLFQGVVINSLVKAGLPSGTFDGLGTGEIQLIMAEIRSIAGGRVFGTPEDWKLAAADRLVALRATSSWLLVAVTLAMVAVLILLTRRTVAADFRARHWVERIVLVLMVACATVAIFVTIGIVGSLMFETFRFFQMVPFWEFILGTSWEPQIPIREDQIAAEGAFGMLPVFLGTLVIATIAMVIATPIGLFSAIYLHEFASPRVRAVVKPVLEILSGVPTVVYGFFAILVIAPAIRSFGADLGLPIAPNTALAAGSVMGIMLVPFISSFADDALGAVPRSLRDGSLAVGATPAETVSKVLFPAAIPGIVGGILLAVSRAIGETMIVVMAAGLIAKMTINPLDSVTTVTVQIVTLLIGDTAFDSPKTLAAFALGMVLFLVTLVINIFALSIVRKYREIYD
ncbi:MAG: phosphate ABC transporter permease subunit PstC [Hoeflea sp.]|uniref:phosphate ABC transporter permease subunit PstC n=1 Tax=Hoeflea sp. TaxID=1940281 RepID=UPI001DB6A45D|nr:phosphate ABC transporter permease subunit PstC [Hoeflea sp.]MBU4531269.1 phosphate ABC transporter permease subunit PstC [Alphaproteobacteria bacterium]MBU4545668.1 phosphate ABC transporter permease subunit PstC [Alphaproteobacteria bacterium]MBU4550637.1 phosphate ABC transporter permease subunit PstC [Alphaproteobacteria bacterium]MBV1724546.1 phosphate ABC transporter permease subunit PstC [Hoeflea sp.]MBV1760566.1 phosphate ABC transporter permease subunit PstC [Hoeflea sp.]